MGRSIVRTCRQVLRERPRYAVVEEKGGRRMIDTVTGTEVVEMDKASPIRLKTTLHAGISCL
jgi:hypothetical protein